MLAPDVFCDPRTLVPGQRHFHKISNSARVGKDVVKKSRQYLGNSHGLNERHQV